MTEAACREVVVGTYHEVMARREDDDVVVLDPRRLCPGRAPGDADLRSVALVWTDGIELLSGRPALIPLDGLGSDDLPGVMLGARSHRGLASGASLAEAVGLALLALLERVAPARSSTFSVGSAVGRRDVLTDIDLLARALRDAGVGAVFAVEVSYQDVPAVLVELIAPEVDARCWELG